MNKATTIVAASDCNDSTQLPSSLSVPFLLSVPFPGGVSSSAGAGCSESRSTMFLSSTNWRSSEIFRPILCFAFWPVAPMHGRQLVVLLVSCSSQNRDRLELQRRLIFSQPSPRW